VLKVKPCIIRKIVYRSSAEKRPTWGFVLAEREGLALLFIPSPDDKRSHSIVIAAENVPERLFEDVNLSRFPLEGQGDMVAIGSKLSSLGEGLSEDEIEQWLKSEGLW
jgi:hypothetical protein